MHGTYFTNKATGHNKVFMVAELSSSVPAKLQHHYCLQCGTKITPSLTTQKQW